MKGSLAYRLYWLILRLSRSNKVFRLLIDLTAYLFYKVFRRNKYFIFQGHKYHYFYHLYNRTVAGERIIEISITKKILDEYSGKNILEVGNVLSHYFPINHDVLDKYDKTQGIINEDVVSFNPRKKYDLIISVSTMEHIGYSVSTMENVGYSYEEPYEPDKFLSGIRNLKKLLAPGGKIVITLPVFFNSNIDKLIKERKTPFNKEYFLKRVSFLNKWVEVDFDEAMKSSGYNSYFANANVLYVGILEI